MLAFFAFIKSPLGKLVAWITSFVLAITILLTLLAIHDHNIKLQALAKFNEKQLEQITKDQQKYIEDTEQLKLNSVIQENLLRKQSENLDNKLSNVDNYLLHLPVNNQKNSSSQVLKKVFKILNGVQ